MRTEGAPILQAALSIGLDGTLHPVDLSQHAGFQQLCIRIVISHVSLFLQGYECIGEILNGVWKLVDQPVLAGVLRSPVLKSPIDLAPSMSASICTGPAYEQVGTVMSQCVEQGIVC